MERQDSCESHLSEDDQTHKLEDYTHYESEMRKRRKRENKFQKKFKNPRLSYQKELIENLQAENQALKFRLTLEKLKNTKEADKSRKLSNKQKLQIEELQKDLIFYRRKTLRIQEYLESKPYSFPRDMFVDPRNNDKGYNNLIQENLYLKEQIKRFRVYYESKPWNAPPDFTQLKPVVFERIQAHKTDVFQCFANDLKSKIQVLELNVQRIVSTEVSDKLYIELATKLNEQILESKINKILI